MKPILTQERLKAVLRYNTKDGRFIRIVKAGRWKAGEVVGSITFYGYYQIYVDGRSYFAHRLAWFYMTGEWPKDQIDHINRDGLDNRFSNLRECTKAENKRNTGPRKNNKSGYKGVCWFKPARKWKATIRGKNKTILLGYFDDKKDAALAYNNAAEEHFGEFAYINEVEL